jgi:hypothetical protein
MVSELRDYLVVKADTHMRDLAYTLHTHRSTLQLQVYMFRKLLTKSKTFSLRMTRLRA